MPRIATIVVAIAAALASAHAIAGAPLTRAITFQGELTQSGAPARGAHDIEIALYNAPTGQTAIDVQAFDDVDVRDGLFTVTPDFTDAPFEDGYGYWLEVRVRDGASTGAYTTLTPRQTLTPVPYAVSALHVADNGVEGDDIVAGAIGHREVDPAQIQSRVTGACAVGQTIRAIAADGTVTCADGGIAGVVAGEGLTGGGTTGTPTVAIDPTTTQRRVTGTCATGFMISAISEEGTVTCAPRGVASVVAGTGLTGGGGGASPTLSIDPLQTQRRVTGNCPATGQAIRGIGADGTVECVTATNIRSVQFVSSTCTLGPGPVGTNTCFGSVTCPAGTRPIGGGFDVGCTGVLTSRLGPRQQSENGPWSWLATIIRPSDLSCLPPNNIVTTYATCAAVD